MSKKHKQGGFKPLATDDLKARVQKARTEGRYQQALELVKQLHKADPSSANLELLKDTYFHRAVQLRTMGYSRDAATVLDVASRLDDKNAAWITKLADEMGRCGDVQRTLALIARSKQLTPANSAPPADQGKLLGSVVDAAFLNDKNGKDALPADLRSEYDVIVNAFALVEAGKDDDAKTTLNAIGLRSPYLDWKLLIRGLQAYYNHDDDRARDNWSRLDPQRVPARLAAPFRAEIDVPYRDAQPAKTQQALRKQLEWVEGGGIAGQLKALRESLANPESLAGAFRAIESLLPTLQDRAPHLVPRLAGCLYWSIMEHRPEELLRYKRVFGAPPDDPEFARITAMAMEREGGLGEAHKSWQRYEKFLAEQRNVFPGEQGPLARALVWLKMGENAASIPDKEQRKKLPSFLRDLEVFPEALHPSADKCFEKSLELAPKLLDAHEGLFEYLVRSEKYPAAIKAAERLLALFPDHVKTLEELAGIYTRQDNHEQARVTLEKAIRHNPLDRDLRQRLGLTHLMLARGFAEKSQFDQARPHYQSGLTYSEPNGFYSVYCRWAACEIKAGDQAKADELLVKARETAPGELMVTYYLLVETSRLDLGNKLKTRLTKEFNKAIEETPTPALGLALARYSYELHASKVTYHGQQTHTKKIIAYATRVEPKDYPELHLVALLTALLGLQAGSRIVNKIFDYGLRNYKKSPWFPYFQALHLMGDDPEETRDHWRVDRLLADAEKLAHSRPADEPGIKEMLDDVKRRRQLIQAFNPFLGGLSRMFGGMGGFGGGPFGGYDDEYDNF